MFPSPQNEPVKEASADYTPNLGFISRQLGHKNSTITSKVYARWLKNDEADGIKPISWNLKWNQNPQKHSES